MRKARTAMLEQGTQAPSPAPDLIPAENERQNLTGNSHSDWYSKRGHFIPTPTCRLWSIKYLETEIAQPWMVVRATAERPMRPKDT